MQLTVGNYIIRVSNPTTPKSSWYHARKKKKKKKQTNKPFSFSPQWVVEIIQRYKNITVVLRQMVLKSFLTTSLCSHIWISFLYKSLMGKNKAKHSWMESKFFGLETETQVKWGQLYIGKIKNLDIWIKGYRFNPHT